MHRTRLTGSSRHHIVVAAFAVVSVTVGYVLAQTDGSAAERGCVRPEVTRLLEQNRGELNLTGTYFPVARALFMSDDANRRQWMGTSWEGPRDGVLFVVDCAGKKIAALQQGAVLRLRAGPVLPIGPTVEVLYMPGTATSEQWTQVDVAFFNGTSIDVLWTQTAIDDVGFPTLADYRDDFAWEFSPDGSKIHVTGQRKVRTIPDAEHNWGPGTAHALPEPTFCWNPARRSYLGC